MERFADDFLAIGQGDLLGVLERIPRKYECLESFADDFLAIGRADLLMSFLRLARAIWLGVLERILVNMSVWSDLLVILGAISS